MFSNPTQLIGGEIDKINEDIHTSTRDIADDPKGTKNT